MLLSKAKKNCLVFGYTRENTLNQQSIPIALIKLFEIFYNNSICWKIPNIKQAFCRWDHKKGPITAINGIPMQLILTKETWRGSHHTVYVVPDMNNLPLNYVGLEFKVSIKENIDNKTDTKSVHYNLDQHQLSNKNAVGCTRYWRLSKSGWNGWNCFQILGLQRHNEFDAEFAIDIVKIKYCKMNTKCSLNWMFDKKEMDLFNTANAIIHSKVFNDWKIKFIPNERDKCKLTLIPTGLPCNGIKTVKIKLILKVIPTFENKQGKEIKFVQLTKFTKNEMVFWTTKWGEGVTFHWQPHRLQGATSLNVFVDIEIRSIYDEEKNEIVKAKWTEYGFIVSE